jgi:transcriptional regulator with XRE-family HTH domain
MNLGRIVKTIREAANLSGQALARMLGVSLDTINHWENGRGVPNRLAQTQLYDICQTCGVDLFACMLDELNSRYAIERERYAPSLVLYHGSKSGIAGNIQPISRRYCDFGSGFYMGNNAWQPLTLVCGFRKAKLYTTRIELDGLSVLRIPLGIEWAMTIAYSRGRLESIKESALYQKYAEIFHGYDVVCGKIANDRMFYVLDRFFAGEITDKALVECLGALPLGEQYVAISERGCSRITILEEQPLSEIEKRCIQEASEKNREHGVKIANDICKQHRRDGRFFDEIAQEGI